MAGSASRIQTGRRTTLRLAGLSFERRACLAALALLLCLFVAAAACALSARRTSRAVSATLPLLASGLVLENLAHEAAHHAAVYAASGGMEYYSGVRVRIASLKTSLVLFAERAVPSSANAVAAMRTAADAFEGHVENERSARDAVTEIAASLRKTADALGRAAEALGAVARDRDVRAIADFALAIARVSLAAETPATNGLDKPSAAGEIETLWRTAEPAFTAAGQKMPEEEAKTDMTVLVRDYEAALANLVEAENRRKATASALEESASELVDRSRALTSLVRAEIADATAETLAAARRAAIVAIAGACVIILAASGAALRHRKQQSRPKADDTPPGSPADDSRASLGHKDTGGASEPQSSSGPVAP